jgi:hypothetical protein
VRLGPWGVGWAKAAKAVQDSSDASRHRQTFIACLTPCPWPRIGREGSGNAAIADDERDALPSAADAAETAHTKIAPSSRMAPSMDCQVCQGVDSGSQRRSADGFLIAVHKFARPCDRARSLIHNDITPP